MIYIKYLNSFLTYHRGLNINRTEIIINNNIIQKAIFIKNGEFELLL